MIENTRKQRDRFYPSLGPLLPCRLLFVKSSMFLLEERSYVTKKKKTTIRIYGVSSRLVEEEPK